MSNVIAFPAGREAAEGEYPEPTLEEREKIAQGIRQLQTDLREMRHQLLKTSLALDTTKVGVAEILLRRRLST